MTKVAIEKCLEYEKELVKEKIETCLSAIGDLASFLKPNGRVFVKLNCVGGFSPDLGITTHPVFLEAIIEILKQYTSDIIVGDNPATKDLVSTLKRCKLYDVITKNNLKILKGDDLITIKNSKPKLYSSFEVSREMIEVDLLVNLPKLKTHSLTYMSIAEKNLFGMIYGLSKAGWHVKANNPLQFGEALNDLYGAILEAYQDKKMLHICDGIIGLEGEGPGTAGITKKAGAILASSDAVSLDRVAAEVCKLDPDKIFVTKIADERNYGEGNLERIEIVGKSLVAFADLRFQEPVNQTSTFGLKLLKYDFLRNLLLEHPLIEKDLCIKCGECVKICPPKTLKIKKGEFPYLKAKECIRCWCCAEVCPQNAIQKTKRPLIGRIALKNRN
ncbi:MAG TPA: DUF362 domain-containing protein [Acholeplasmataceae bacterium]|jgi:uncharacterized protein (DUF362 family)/Pyruvate/2-oxoacid:ferredoxin oxidoreductase delta subunit|nr:DUF362 domain-containing protein [Acholeplasmataceae bacterium]